MELLEEHDLGEIILIGHSLGGKVAMLFALQYPDRVTKLVIVDISLRKHEANREHQQLINAMLAVDFSLCNVRSDVEKQLIHDIRSARLRRFLLKNVYWRDKRSLDWRINLPVINANLPAISEGIDPGNEFKKPVLFVRGGLSDYILDDDIIKIHSTFPSAIIRTLENAGHWVHADEPLEFFEMVNDFLSRR
jgi:pimeloyl-ACP methyl ester carboxylesterase